MPTVTARSLSLIPWSSVTATMTVEKPSLKDAEDKINAILANLDDTLRALPYQTLSHQGLRIEAAASIVWKSFKV